MRPRSGITRRGLVTGAGALLGLGALSAFARRRPTSGVTEVSRPALGTWVRVVVHGESPERASTAIDAAFDAIRGVDAEMSIHRADSVLARLNANAGHAPVAIPGSLRQVLTLALDFSRRSTGVYDPTILPLMRLWGFYGNERRAVPSDREIAAALELTGIGRVLFDGTHCGLSRTGMSLDLGSIGKGWALDRAADALRAHGVSSALVDVGGNVYGLGTPEGRPEGWAVGVTHPATGALVRTFHLRDSAVGTSANTEQHHEIAGLTVGHILDARRGRPADGPLAVTVAAKTGVLSDVLSTTAFLMGPSRFVSFSEATAVEFVG